MDFVDQIRELSMRVSKHLDSIQTEEATKHAMVMPFISALGYNVFDPSEVKPELCADVGVKKGEKVDYAILRDGKPVILIECKHHSANLGKEHASQLYRYFSVTDARFAVLTNGVSYWFYSDLVSSNVMDDKPFFEFNLFDIKDSAIEELKKFSKAAFDLENILTTASDLKYTKELSRLLASQMQNPTDAFIKLLASDVYSGKVITQNVKEQFSGLIKRAFSNLVNERINERLKTAMASDGDELSIPSTLHSDQDKAELRSDSDSESEGIVTTEEEIEAFHIVKAILREVIPVERVFMRDVQSYCGILLDNNNRKPLIRLYFNSKKKKSIGLFDVTKDEKINISTIDQIYDYTDRLKATVTKYDEINKE